MIARVNGWRAPASALLLVLSYCAAAEDLGEAAHDLARRTAAFSGQQGLVSITWRNLSSLGPSDMAQARAAFETALKDAGARISDSAAQVEGRITFSETPGQYLLVEEARKGDERQVWIASWTRTASPSIAAAAALEKKLVWEQDEQVLDAAFPGDIMLVLTPANLVWLMRQDGQWARAMSMPISAPKAWPRDMRGRLRVAASGFQAYLPGVACSGEWQPPVSLDCKPSDRSWILESGRAMLAAGFAPGRNYFEGPVTTQTGAAKTLAPLYSAAAVEDRSATTWLVAAVDGRTLILDSAFATAGTIDSWGSDIAGVGARCGASPVIATKPGDGSARDAAQAFSVVDGAAVPFTAPVEFPGPVTALWPSGSDAALAVARNESTGRYGIYRLTIACGR